MAQNEDAKMEQGECSLLCLASSPVMLIKGSEHLLAMIAGRSMKLSEMQWQALEACVAGRDDSDWLDLSGRGILPSTIRAFAEAGVIESRAPGFPRQVLGQRYRVTVMGQATLTTRRHKMM